MTADASPTAATDGRRLRSERSRDAVVDALLALYDEGELRPGAAAIAARAGVSERSVFRHFEDLDALVESAIARQWARIRHRFAPPDPTGSRARRASALVEQRLAIHDIAAPAMRAASLLAPDSSRLSETFALRRRLLDAQVEQQFARELARRARADREELARALCAIASLEHVEYLRAHAALSRGAARAVLTRTTRALLTSKVE
jgi:AcrR family transcriptional regulator